MPCPVLAKPRVLPLPSSWLKNSGSFPRGTPFSRFCGDRSNAVRDFQKQRHHHMTKISILELAKLTELSRESVRRRLGDMKSEPGPKNAKVYRSGPALRRILGANEKQEVSSESESRRRLNEARLAAIEMEMRLKHRGLVNIFEAEPIISNHCLAIARIVAAWRGKTVGDTDLERIFCELQDAHAEALHLYGLTAEEVFDLKQAMRRERLANQKRVRSMSESCALRHKEYLEDCLEGARERGHVQLESRLAAELARVDEQLLSLTEDAATCRLCGAKK